MSSSRFHRPERQRGLAPLVLAAGAAFAVMSGGAALAKEQAAAPAATDPVKMGWMQGSPPPKDRIIRMSDGSMLRFPQIRWSFSHMRELLPTRNVPHASTPRELPVALRDDLDSLAFRAMDGREMTWKDMLANTYADSIIVLHDGKVVYEKYFGAAKPELPHQAMSVTKSVIGTLAAVLAAEGRLDPQAPVTKYVPELKDSAYGDATVRDVMDMRVGVDYTENYQDPQSSVWDYARAGGLIPRPPGYTGPDDFAAFLQRLKKQGQHGASFSYKTANAEALTWIVRRAAGKSIAELVRERIWEPIGAGSDAYFLIDPAGQESGGGGFNATLRDLARFGELMRNDGRVGDRQVIPASVVADIRKGGDRAAFAAAGYKTLPGWSYRDMWWVTGNADGAFMARGIHGQSLYVDPAAKMVIVRFASHPVASNTFNDPLTLPAFAAMAERLKKQQ
ncbi:serine hydrolase domain-containing protein [Camelimonas abortus]|uniref:Serine hydrolase domain-containing protein n=1 Tax=Camelimonas abortus TaxID=1017184 RepID=A0ABV7LAE6_9HYPH